MAGDSNNFMDKLITHIKNIIGIIVTYFKCSLIDGIIIGVANFAFMYFMEMPWKIAISIIMGVTNLIPNVGPVIGALVGGVILAFYDMKLVLYFLIFTIIIQVIDGLIIKPKIFGDSFGISGVWMLIAMIVGGGVFGVIGMVLVVPVIAIAKYLYKSIKAENNEQTDK